MKAISLVLVILATAGAACTDREVAGPASTEPAMTTSPDPAAIASAEPAVTTSPDPAVATSTAPGTAGRCDDVPLDVLAPFVDDPASLQLTDVYEAADGLACTWTDGATQISLGYGGLDVGTPMGVLLNEVAAGGQFADSSDVVVRVVPPPPNPQPAGSHTLTESDREVAEAHYIAPGPSQLGFYGSILRVSIVASAERPTSANEVIALAEALVAFVSDGPTSGDAGMVGPSHSG